MFCDWFAFDVKGHGRLPFAFCSVKEECEVNFAKHCWVILVWVKWSARWPSEEIGGREMNPSCRTCRPPPPAAKDKRSSAGAPAEATLNRLRILPFLDTDVHRWPSQKSLARPPRLTTAALGWRHP